MIHRGFPAKVPWTQIYFTLIMDYDVIKRKKNPSLSFKSLRLSRFVWVEFFEKWLTPFCFLNTCEMQ